MTVIILPVIATVTMQEDYATGRLHPLTDGEAAARFFVTIGRQRQRLCVISHFCKQINRKYQIFLYICSETQSISNKNPIQIYHYCPMSNIFFPIKKLASSFAVAVMILGASCSASKEERHGAPEFYDLSVYEKAKAADLLETAAVVPLLFERDTYPKYALIASFSDSVIVIEEGDERVHVFSTDGHYIGCSQYMQGKGPEEHTIFIGHVLNPYTNTVDIMSFMKMQSYDPDFTRCKRESLLPTRGGSGGSLLYDEGLALSESRYLLHSRTATVPYLVTLYDFERGKAIRTWSYEEDVKNYFSGGGRQRFFRISDNEILMDPNAHSPYIYGFDGEGRNMYKAIEMKYGDNTVSDHVMLEDFYKNPKIGKDYYENSSIEIPWGRYVNSEKIVTMIEVGPDQRRDKYFLFTDRDNGHTYRVEAVENGELILTPFYYIDEEYIYNILTKEHIIDNPHSLLNMADEAESLLAEIDDEDFVLIKYRFKK